jgi:hypothetical protein
MSTSTVRTSRPPVSAPEFVLWTAATLVGGFFLPGLGLVIGLILAFTRLRSTAPAMRWSLAAVGALLLVIQITGLASSGGGSHVSPITRVS